MGATPHTWTMAVGTSVCVCAIARERVDRRTRAAQKENWRNSIRQRMEQTCTEHTHPHTHPIARARIRSTNDSPANLNINVFLPELSRLLYGRKWYVTIVRCWRKTIIEKYIFYAQHMCHLNALAVFAVCEACEPNGWGGLFGTENGIPFTTFRTKSEKLNRFLRSDHLSPHTHTHTHTQYQQQQSRAHTHKTIRYCFLIFHIVDFFLLCATEHVCLFHIFLALSERIQCVPARLFNPKGKSRVMPYPLPLSPSPDLW